jgi:hypothetical protein
VVKPPPKITNKFQTWYLLVGIAVIAGLNLAMTSLLTTQSLAEMGVEPPNQLIEPVYKGDLTIADVDVSPIPEIDVASKPVTRPGSATYESRHIARVLPPAERIVSSNNADLFKPRIITIPRSEPIALRSMPVAPSETRPVYLAKLNDNSPAMSARIVTRKRDPLMLRIIKKPWQLIKAVASKLN